MPFSGSVHASFTKSKAVKGGRSERVISYNAFPDRSPNMVLRLLLHPTSSFGGSCLFNSSIRKHERLFPTVYILTLLGSFS